MKKTLIKTLIISLLFALPTIGKCAKWELACQAYSFKDNTLEETLQALNKVGIKHVELFKNQKMSADDPRNIDFNMPAEQIDKLKTLLKQYHIKAASYGVIYPGNEKQWQAMFKFAKQVGIEMIISEPKEELLPMIDDLCKQYKIKLAIHNHVDPKPYWSPSLSYKALEGRSKYMGICPDLGQWHRSGCDVVEGLKLHEGHIFEIHVKDVTKGEKSGVTTVMGTGDINWEGVFAELSRQKFKGKLVIEHDHSWDNPVPDIQKNVTFLQSYNK